jgi:copper homeostasis protein
MRAKYIVEIAIDTLSSAYEAHRGGATRLELCSALSTGGLSPNIRLLQAVKQWIPMTAFVMIRPREGDFVYTRQEVDYMKSEIDLAMEYGADGFVFGALNENGEVDIRHTVELVQHCAPLPVTYHRAFDCTKDLTQSLEALIECGCHRVLTSGGGKSVVEKREIILALHQQAKGRIKILAGAGITPENFGQIFHPVIDEYHMSGQATVVSPLSSGLFEMNYKETSHTKVAAVVDLLKEFTQSY